MRKKILPFIFILGLLYIILPGPTSVEDFSPLPQSAKSDEPGDTVQVPNIAAFFSFSKRAEITEFYRQDYQDSFIFGKFFPPLTLNYPPEEAKRMVRDQIYVTFMEEYVYPLRGSIFVGGYEPFVHNELLKAPHNFVGDHVHINGVYYDSKTTLRFYPNNIIWRIFVYLAIWGLSISVFKIWRKSLQKEII
ncbi:MAG: hypothetical protein HYW45_00315 [Candidatus Daviesbacteria bacterium]|nr:MAG: hypothetical protein HYW45_00315 [Candidatus Daviesbacteria bacterium]